MPDQVALETWGVVAKDVLGMAPHVVLAAPPAGDAGIWATNQAGKTTKEQVEKWITDIASMVDLRLRKRSKLTDSALVTRVERGAHSITVVGATATLISAVYPTMAGVNSQTSYSAELWARYNREIDALADAIDEWIAEGDTSDTGGGISQGTISGNFPAPAFPDGMNF